MIERRTSLAGAEGDLSSSPFTAEVPQVEEIYRVGLAGEGLELCQ